MSDLGVVVPSAQLTAAGNRFARMLDHLGVGPRGAVAALTGNVPEYLAAYRGTTWSGRQFTPMSWRWTPDEVAYVVENCGAEVLVVEARFAALAARAAPLIPADRRFAIGGEIPGFRPFAEIDVQSGEALADPVAGTTMMYTSGTTGRPKGVRRDAPAGPPPGDLGRYGAVMLRSCLGENDDRRHLVCTPMYHAGPLTYADGASLLGADLVLMDRFDPERVLAAIEHHGATSAFMVPTQFVRLLRLPEPTRARYDTSSMRMLVHGSAPVAGDTKRAMIDWFGPVLYEFYGGTEGGNVSIGSTDWLEHPGSVGKPRAGMRMEIRDSLGQGLAVGEPGEIWFNDGRQFEYKDDPEKTSESVREGWFTLGDIGYLDESGYLYLCDRRADVVISGGVNVYPAQVEAVLTAHPLVADCCVVGVPDDEWGESLRAVVQPVGGAEPSERLATELLAHCRAGLAGYQVPRDVDFDADLPRTETGKLARRTVRQRYWAGRERAI